MFRALGRVLIDPGAAPGVWSHPLKVVLRSVAWTLPPLLVGVLGGLLYRAMNEGPDHPPVRQLPRRAPS